MSCHLKSIGLLGSGLLLASWLSFANAANTTDSTGVVTVSPTVVVTPVTSRGYILASGYITAVGSDQVFNKSFNTSVLAGPCGAGTVARIVLTPDQIIFWNAIPISGYSLYATQAPSWNATNNWYTINYHNEVRYSLDAGAAKWDTYAGVSFFWTLFCQ